MSDHGLRSAFPGFFRPSDDEFGALWENGRFVLDANVLLNLYRYSADTARGLLDLLTLLGERLWVPHQAAAEFLKNRLVVIQQRSDMYDELLSDITKAFGTLSSAADRLRRHPELDEQVVRAHAETMVEALNEYVRSQRERAVDLLEGDALGDTILAEVTTLLEGRVGPPIPEDELAQLYEEGEARLAQERPPGYADARTKDGVSKYGDYVIWEQMLRHAKEQAAPIIFITDEDKEDWWWKHKGKTIAPRRELIEEMRLRAGVPFYMYRPNRFMEEAGRFLKAAAIATEAIEEVAATDPWQVHQIEAEARFTSSPTAHGHTARDASQGFRGPEVCRIIGITNRQLDYWVRTNLLRPSLAESRGSGYQRLYSYQDLIELAIMKRLLDAGLSLQSVRRAVAYLRENARGQMEGANLVIDGSNTAVLADSGEEIVDLLRYGTGVLNIIPLAGVREELDRAIESMTTDPDLPPSAA